MYHSNVVCIVCACQYYKKRDNCRLLRGAHNNKCISAREKKIIVHFYKKKKKKIKKKKETDRCHLLK